MNVTQSTIIMLDNSSSAINGDYFPTRWEGQVQAATQLIETKLKMFTNSSVGIGLMAGRQVQILCTPTTDSSKAASSMWTAKLSGSIKFSQSLQVAALALKHRKSTSQKQRIVCFVGSQITESQQQLKLLGKKFKKNCIAVDMIGFGELSQIQRTKIKAFHSAVLFEENSNYFFIQPQFQYMVDVLRNTKIYGHSVETDSIKGDQIDPQLAMARALCKQDQEINKKSEMKMIEQQQLSPQQIIKNIQNGTSLLQNKNEPQKFKERIDYSEKQQMKLARNKLQQKMIEEQIIYDKYNQENSVNNNQNSINNNQKDWKTQKHKYDEDQDDDKKKKKDKDMQCKTMVSQNQPQQFSISHRRPPINHEISQLFKTQKATQFMKVFEGMQQEDDQQFDSTNKNYTKQSNPHNKQKNDDDKKNKTEKHN